MIWFRMWVGPVQECGSNSSKESEKEDVYDFSWNNYVSCVAEKFLNALCAFRGEEYFVAVKKRMDTVIIMDIAETATMMQNCLALVDFCRDKGIVDDSFPFLARIKRDAFGTPLQTNGSQ